VQVADDEGQEYVNAGRRPSAPLGAHSAESSSGASGCQRNCRRHLRAACWDRAPARRATTMELRLIARLPRNLRTLSVSNA
jgi:hypothetical protein